MSSTNQPEPSEEFSLEDILREFGASDQSDQPSVAAPITPPAAAFEPVQTQQAPIPDPPENLPVHKSKKQKKHGGGKHSPAPSAPARPPVHRAVAPTSAPRDPSRDELLDAIMREFGAGLSADTEKITPPPTSSAKPQSSPTQKTDDSPAKSPEKPTAPVEQASPAAQPSGQNTKEPTSRQEASAAPVSSAKSQSAPTQKTDDSPAKRPEKPAPPVEQASPAAQPPVQNAKEPTSRQEPSATPVSSGPAASALQDLSQEEVLENIIKEFGGPSVAPAVAEDTPQAPAKDQSVPQAPKAAPDCPTAAADKSAPNPRPSAKEPSGQELPSASRMPDSPAPAEQGSVLASCTDAAPEKRAAVAGEDLLDTILKEFGAPPSETAASPAPGSFPETHGQTPKKPPVEAVAGSAALGMDARMSVAQDAASDGLLDDILKEFAPDPIMDAALPTQNLAESRHDKMADLLDDAELDEILQKVADPREEADAAPMQAEQRLEQLEQTLREDIRQAEPSDFFEEQFGGYAPEQTREEAQPTPEAPEEALPEEPDDAQEMEDSLTDDDVFELPPVGEAIRSFFRRRKKPAPQPVPEEPVPLQPDVPTTVTVNVPADSPVPKPHRKKHAAHDPAQQTAAAPVSEEPRPKPQPTEPLAEERDPAPTAQQDQVPPRHRARIPVSMEPNAYREDEEYGEDDEDDAFLPFVHAKKKKPAPQPAPIPTVKEAYRTYSERLGHTHTGLILSLVLTLICLALTAYYSFGWTFIAGLSDAGILAWCVNVVLAVTLLLYLSVFVEALRSLGNKHVTLELLMGFAGLITLADGVMAALQGRVPYAATACMLLTLSQWGRFLQNEGMYRTVKVLEKNEARQAIVRSETVYHDKAALFTADADTDTFMAHLEQPTAADLVMGIYVPLIFVLTLALAIFAQVKGKIDFLQAWAPLLLACVPVAGLLSYGRAFSILARRLARRGAALCGWYGAKTVGNNAAVLLRDLDLFPEGCVEPNGVKSYNGYTGNQVVGYAAAVMNRAGSGLAPVLDSLLEREGGRHMQVEAIRLYENGGIGGKFGRDAVLVGTLSFMHRMGVHMNPETKVKRATYVSVNGELAGLVAIRYVAAPAVRDALQVLTRSSRSKPILATCNVSITPKLLKMKFRIAPDRFAYPSLRERAQLAARQPEEDSALCAMLVKPQIGSFADVAMGGKLLQSVVRAGLVMAVLSGVIGVAVMGVLCLTGAIVSLSAAYLLLFDLIWMVPTLLLTGWTRNY